MKKIMVVEDEMIVAEDIKVSLMSSGYDVCAKVRSGEEAIRKVEEHLPDLIMMDVVLDGEMDGITAAEEINSRFDIPVIYLTAHATKEYLNRAKSTSPYGYLTKPVIHKDLHASVEIALHKHLIDKKLNDKNAQLKKIMYSTINTITKMINIKNPFLKEHQFRVRQLSEAIAEEMGIPEDQIEGLCLTVEIHDIGMISVPIEILSKPTPLSESECNIYKSHAKAGYDLLKEIEFSWPVANIVHQHHEKLDGSGYPHGLKGEDILLEARIISVASSIDSYTQGRPGSLPIKMDDALEKIKQERGICYDSDVVDACMKVIKEKGFEFE